MRLATLFFLLSTLCWAQDKPAVKDAHFWLSEALSAGQYYSMAKVTSDNERGRYTHDTLHLPYGHGWNYGMASVGVGANTALTLFARHMEKGDSRFWRTFANYVAPIASGVVIIPGTIHRAHTGRNNAPIW